MPNVVSIHVSGHKYGLVYPGVGWALWRSKEYLPEDLLFHVNYLGGDLPTYTLNLYRLADLQKAVKELDNSLSRVANRSDEGIHHS